MAGGMAGATLRITYDIWSWLDAVELTGRSGDTAVRQAATRGHPDRERLLCSLKVTMNMPLVTWR